MTSTLPASSSESFTRRRTFSIGPTLPQSAAPPSKHQTPPQCSPSTKPAQRRHLQRTSSAPVFTRRAVESVPAVFLAAAANGVVPSLPPFPAIDSSRGTVYVRRSVSSHAAPSREVSHNLRTPHAASPDPRAPRSSETCRNFSPPESDAGSKVAATAAAVPSPVNVVLPSIASSIHSGFLGVMEDASFSPKWYPAWAAAPPTAAPAATTTTTTCTVSYVGSTGKTSEREHPPASYASTSHLPAAHERTPARRCPGGGGDVSSLFPASLGHTMPPPKRSVSHYSTREVAESDPSLARVCVRVESCRDLPRAPFCAAAAEKGSGGGDAVYVYMRTAQGGTCYKSPSLPYAVTVDFTGFVHDFYVPLQAPPCGAEVEEADVLTFTVAVRPSDGKQVKMGIGRLAVCNLSEGEAISLSMPIVAKAGTTRARERGVLTVSVRVCQGPSWLLIRPLCTQLEETYVRGRVLAVLRRACRTQLDQVEVFVRRHCRDSAAELDSFLRKMESSHLLFTQSVRSALGYADKVGEGTTSEGRSARHVTCCAPSVGHPSSSSAFTSCVLDEGLSALHTFVFPPQPTEKPDVAQREGQHSRRSATVGSTRKREVLQRNPIREQRSMEVERAAAQVPQEALPSVQPRRACAGDQTVRVTVRAVGDLRDAQGLPLRDCANCFVTACITADGASAPKGSANGSRELPLAFTTESAPYKGCRAVFPEVTVAVTVAASLNDPVLCCTVWSGGRTMRREVGLCNVSLSHLTTRAGGAAAAGAGYVVVSNAGGPRAYPCGELLLAFQSVAQHPSRGPVTAPGAHHTEPMDGVAQEAHRTTMRRRVLSFLWHSRRSELHRLDRFVEVACMSGFDAFVARQWATTVGGATNSPPVPPPSVVRNALRLTIRAVSLRCDTVDGSTGSVQPHSSVPAAGDASLFSSVCVVWSCGCCAGRSSVPFAVSKLPFTLCLNERLPPLEDVDVYRDELCLALYGTPAATREGDIAPEELCRTHVSLRSFSAGAATVQLPLVFHAGERGAFEGGCVSVDVRAVEHQAASVSPSEFREAQWRGFCTDWPPRVAATQLLRCYATDQLHRLLPLLADAEGKEDALVRRLQATYGATSTPAQLRVCFVGFRCHRADYRACYLKVYHHDVSLLRTPTFACCSSGGDSKTAYTVPLLDEDKYLFQFSTADPHCDRVLVKMGVEHLLRHNDVVAYAELCLAAFVSLESRLASSLHKASPSGVSCHASARSPLWVLLCNGAGETVGEVAVRVEWLHAVPLAPVRRVTTQKKSSVTAVLRTGANNDGDTGGGGGSKGASSEPIPLLDRPTMCDLFSLLSACVPAELYRWSWYLSRWGDATTAHAKLRAELLSPLHVATVYVDIAGIIPRSNAERTRLQAALGESLMVSATCLGSSSSQPISCPLLPYDATHTPAQAAALFHAIDRADLMQRACQRTLRLDLQLPTTDSVDTDLCLVFRSAARGASSTSPRSHSAPRRGRRAPAAAIIHHLRSRSAAAVASLLPAHSAHPSGTAGPSTSPAAAVDVCRVRLSLQALLTTPELYRDGEVFTVPLVQPRSNSSCEAQKHLGEVVAGDVCLRVRTPAHEPPPAWLRYGETELKRIFQRGRLSRGGVQSRLRERQLELEAAGRAEARDEHAAFFRTCAAAATAHRCKQRAQTAHSSAESTLRRAHVPPRPPLAPRQSPVSKPCSLPLSSADAFRVQAVFPRAHGGTNASVAELDDFTTPRKCTENVSQHEWSSEKGGVTVERSSAAMHSTVSADSASTSSRARHVTAQRVLFA